MKIIGLSAGGSRNGSADILLKEALRAAEQAGVDVTMVRVDDLNLSLGPNTAHDDADWFWDLLMRSDGLIVSSPIYSRTIPGKLRLLGDKISGPQADVAFTSEILRLRAAGEPISVNFDIDERVLMPRVGAFIAVGGALPTRWSSLTLPVMHTLSSSMQMAIVDQVQFAAAGSPSSIVLNTEALDRAAQLGLNVASQLGRSYDDAQYLGAPGLCPLCHLDVIVFTPAGVIECATCGAAGEAVVVDGRVAITFPERSRGQSILTIAEKIDHFREVQETAARHAAVRGDITARAEPYAGWERPSVPPRD